MTPPTPAAALAAALEPIPVSSGSSYYNQWPTPEVVANRLAAAGWQVTREEEGLRAALDNLLRHHNAGSKGHHSGYRLTQCEFAQQAQRALAAADASGEEGQ